MGEAARQAHLSESEPGKLILLDRAKQSDQVVRNIAISELAQTERAYYAANLLLLPGNTAEDRMEVLKAWNYGSEHRQIVTILKCKLSSEPSAPVRERIGILLRSISAADRSTLRVPYARRAIKQKTHETRSQLPNRAQKSR